MIYSLGHLTIVDGDEVSTSNLHRQVIHSENRVGINKAESAVEVCKQLNPLGNFKAVSSFLTPDLAVELFPQHDIVVDATDNACARYLINDAAVIFKKPLVSGSALRWEGQLCIYNHFQRPENALGPRDKPLGHAPCYRCVFPALPPTADDAGACDKHGVVGTSPGLLGIMQAHETIKLAAGLHDKVIRKLMIFDGLDAENPIRAVWIRGRRKECVVCGDNPSITDVRNVNYGEFLMCGSPPTMKTSQQISAAEVLSKHILYDENDNFKGVSSDIMLLDVRPANQFCIVNIPGSVNIPLDVFSNSKTIEDLPQPIQKFLVENKPIYVLCRRGNDSRIATELLWQLSGACDSHPREIRDVTKGLLGMKEIESSIPIV